MKSKVFLIVIIIVSIFWAGFAISMHGCNSNPNRAMASTKSILPEGITEYKYSTGAYVYRLLDEETNIVCYWKYGNLNSRIVCMPYKSGKEDY